MTDTTNAITAREFREAEGVEDWRVLSEGACAFFRTESFAASAELVRAIAEAIDDAGHPPDVDIRSGGVTVRLITLTDDYYGMSQRDVDLARKISEVARGEGLSADTSAVQTLLVIPGAPVTAEVMPFWRAALGYKPRPDSPEEDLVDPFDRGPAFWFEAMNEPRPDGGGAIHVAIWVPYEQAEARVAAALAAGGRLVRDDFAPAWWTLADAAGNEVDIATAMNRD
jgi:4a-hydroxytetrahydrobiopterin dehydratase